MRGSERKTDSVGDDAVDQNEKGEEGSVGVHVGAGQRKSEWEEFRRFTILKHKSFPGKEDNSIVEAKRR